MVTSLMELMREVLVTLSRFCIFDLKSHTFFSSTVPARATKFYSSALSLTQAFSWPNSVLVPFCVLSKQPLLGLKQTCGIEITSILPKVAYFSFFLDPFLIPLLPTPSSYQFFLSLGSSYLWILSRLIRQSSYVKFCRTSKAFKRDRWDVKELKQGRGIE